ncbi:methyltransferase domain-containing protein [Planctomycetota bacterium]
MTVELTDILRCPQTGQRLKFNKAASVWRGDGSEVAYPVIDGIIDFCPQTRDRISASYDRFARRYDPYITSSSISAKFLEWLVWGSTKGIGFMEEVLALLPRQFDGILLDVPVGTGVFTSKIYSRYPQATIIGVDCSMNMLRRAKKRFQEQGLNNVHLLKADAAHLPIDDLAADRVLSMNGWHAFADKQRVNAEINRVLRQEGRLIACGYVKGDSRLADLYIKHFCVRIGCFTPPFFSFDDIADVFREFKITHQGSANSGAYFEACKQDPKA